jgi:hypothetical protein
LYTRAQPKPTWGVDAGGGGAARVWCVAARVWKGGDERGGGGQRLGE